MEGSAVPLTPCASPRGPTEGIGPYPAYVGGLRVGGMGGDGDSEPGPRAPPLYTDVNHTPFVCG